MSFQGPRGPNGLTAGFRLFIIQRHRRKKRPLGEEGETAEAERGQKGMDNRTSKQNYYLDIADSVLERSTCLRRKYGAIIVRNDEIISTGYNGAPRGRRNCSDLGPPGSAMSCAAASMPRQTPSSRPPGGT